jgi:hypothetical protein
LRTIGRANDRQGYFRAAQVARREAKAYAEMFCSKYFEFQLGWAQALGTLEVDPQLKALFSEVSRVSATVEIDSFANGAGLLREGIGSLRDGAASFGGRPLGEQSPGEQRVPGVTGAAVSGSAAAFSGAPPNAFGSSQTAPKPDLFDFDLDLEALGIDIDDD